MHRSGEPGIATIAASIGQPARAAMLSAMLGAEPLTVNDLAARAGVAPATASLHLRRLAEDALVVGRRVGRTRRYELAGPDVARALEALQRIAPPQPVRSLAGANAAERLRFARSCYDHLAGELGVAVTDALVAGGQLQADPDAYALTPQGEKWLEELGADPAALRRSRRAFAAQCLDWSERRPHVAGAVGAALLDRFVAARWLNRRRGERTLDLTPLGAGELGDRLGIALEPTGR
jgi:DNA-binding transcriptional ArsR family regulator